MNINLIYEGKDYNFDIPNGVTIDYLKELSSRIFNSDKALLDLVYNNQKIENKDDNALIRDLIPEGETNTILTVQINKDTNNSTKDEIVPLVSLKTKISEIDDPVIFFKNDKMRIKKKFSFVFLFFLQKVYSLLFLSSQSSNKTDYSQKNR